MSESDVAVDTSVAIPLLHVAHPSHATVVTWAAGKSLHLSGHALVETYAVLTRLPGDARVSRSDAVTLIEENFEHPLVLSSEAARGVHRAFAARGIAGGAAYDALVALAAREVDMPLATRDGRARATYEALGVAVEIIGSADPG